MERIYNHTQAICPHCRTKVNARVVERDKQIFLEKYCPEHGPSLALISSDAAWYRASRAYVKPGQNPKAYSIDHFSGCPDSCGLCPQHQQHTCLPVVEITTACDMDCPICLKALGPSEHMSLDEFDFILGRLREYEGDLLVINLSGGEPTLHPRLAQFLQLAQERNVMQMTVSTNGNRFLYDQDLRRLFRETGTIASLQFDGFTPQTYRTLRGENCAAKKMEIIKLLEKADINYSLVVTVVQGVNDQDITGIVDFFFESQALSLMFQPAAFTGRAENMATPMKRSTIPDVVHAIEKSEYITVGDFNPLPCAHFACFALAYYFHIENREYLSMKEFLGLDDFLEVISNRTLPGLDHEGYSLIRNKIYDFWSAADADSSSERVLARIRDILREMSRSAYSPKGVFTLGTSSMKSIFIHQFMDIHTMDLGRLIKCCNHYPQVDGRLLPMCAMNVFHQKQ